MADKILSTTDENSIVVSAEFVTSSKKTKSEPVKCKWYSIELIVNKKITCNNFIDAIEKGLKAQLNRSSSTTRDSKKKANVFISDTRRPSLQSGEDKNITYNEINDKDVLRTCLSIFNKSVGTYKAENYKENPNYTNSPRIHCVSRGSINSKIFRDDNNKYIEHKNSVASNYQIWLTKIKDGNKKLDELGFMTGSRIIFDATGKQSSAVIFDDENIAECIRYDVPLYNISDRPLLTLDSEPVKIIPPSEPPLKPKQNMLLMLLQPLLMIGVMVIIRMMVSSNQGSGMVIMMVAMAAVTAIMAIINMRNQKDEYSKQLKSWKKQYEQYIRNQITNIKKKQEWDIEHLRRWYPAKFSETVEEKKSFISKLKNRNKKKSKDEYPTLVKLVNRVDSSIFSRDQSHPDFLAVRIGLSTEGSQLVPSVFEIIGEKKEVLFSSVRYKNIENLDKYEFKILMEKDLSRADKDKYKYLVDLPFDISKKHAYLNNAPVLLRLKECASLGMVFSKNIEFYPFLENFLLDLCYYHSPDDLQCIMFCEEENDWIKKDRMIEKYKHLSHFNELLDDISAFAFDEKHANRILNKVFDITNKREEEKSYRSPHIVIIFLEEYGFKKHRLSDFLPNLSVEKNKSIKDISFVFCTRHHEKLPKYCDKVIKAVDDSKWYLLPHKQITLRADNETIKEKYKQYAFKPELLPPNKDDLDRKNDKDEVYRAFKILSALHYHRIAQAGDVPSIVDFFELYGFKVLSNIYESPFAKEQSEKIIKKNISNNWKDKQIDITKSLAVPIGKKEDGIVVNLDLHENADGPHMLVAGTTGSGKTETVLTYLLGLCTKYSPKQVNLLLVDMKGGGFIKRLNGLPHIVGTVTDIDDDDKGNSSVYMLKRFLHSMSSETKKRKICFNDMGVDSIDGYIRAKNNLREHIEKLKSDRPDEINAERVKKIQKLPNLAHLFMVVDEFTELMRFSSDNDDIDFKSEITSLARVGRSLGFHIILVSQNIENAITPDIRVNSRARLCLKVATREASKEMINTDHAASPHMPGNGRAYLLVGTGSRFEYFQSGFSGADILGVSDEAFRITHAKVGDEYSMFYDSSSEKSNSNQKSDNQISFLRRMIIDCGKDADAPSKVLQPLLPTQCYYDWSNMEERFVNLDNYN